MDEVPADEAKFLKKVNLFYGRLNDPTSSAILKGPCGDSMEFYLVIENETVADIKVYSDGCGATQACAVMAADLVYRKTIKDALFISPGEVIRALKVLPEDHLHCAILAVSTLYRAIADYLLQKGR